MTLLDGEKLGDATWCSRLDQRAPHSFFVKLPEDVTSAGRTKLQTRMNFGCTFRHHFMAQVEGKDWTQVLAVDDFDIDAMPPCDEISDELDASVAPTLMV